MENIVLDYSKVLKFASENEINSAKIRAEEARKTLLSGTGKGNDFLGWVELPKNYDRSEFSRIKKAAAKIQSDSEVLIVIGIGGSYLGARAAIEFLSHSFYNCLGREKRSKLTGFADEELNNKTLKEIWTDDLYGTRNEKRLPEIYFAGNSISSKYLSDLIDVVGDRDFSVNIISKSGTTTEPAIAFRVFREILEKKYGHEEACRRIYCTTDRNKGALKELANEEGYESFVVPDDIGGRYSVLTAVGLLPIAVSGIDIDSLMQGAADMSDILKTADYENNIAMKYAAIRNLLYEKGKTVEILTNYEPSAHYVSEWWKQLFGESEGKDKKGIFPAAADLTTDLHSMGQFIQDGNRILMETVLSIDENDYDIILKKEEKDTDGMNYLAGKNMDFVNKSAMAGTIIAHEEGQVPCMKVQMKKQDAYTLGQLFYFFEFACGISGYMLGVNPFDQPGVESYKKNMFALLGKPGYEELGKKLRARS